MCLGKKKHSKVIQEEPNSSDAIFIKSLCLFYNGQFDSARSHAQHVLRIDPDHNEAAKLIRVRSSPPPKKKKKKKSLAHHNLFLLPFLCVVFNLDRGLQLA